MASMLTPDPLQAASTVAMQIACDPNGTGNASDSCDSNDNAMFERVVSILVPVFFGLIAVLGFVGNILVLVVVIFNRQMRNTTNILILNLAVADLLFIMVCVPFTATIYAMPLWPFGDAWCKIYQYVIYVTAYGSVYTLVLMSLDRYLAVVHPISSMTIRTERNTWLATLLVWLVILVGHVPSVMPYMVVEYDYEGEMRSSCINQELMVDQRKGRTFYGCFFAFGYAIPLALVTVLYGTMIKRLLHGVVPRGCQSGEASRSKRRVTRMVVIVVIIFALCWLPIQIIFLTTYFGNYPETALCIAIKIAATCIAYMNSCVNPILYAFLSENFRKGFRKVLSLGRAHSKRYDFERSNTRALDPLTKSSHVENGV